MFSETLYTVQFALSVEAFIVCLAFLCRLVHRTHCTANASHYRASALYLTFSAIVCFGTALIYFVIGLTATNTLAQQFMRGFLFLFYSLAQILVYIVFVVKLSNTKIPPSRRSYAVSRALLSLYSVLCAIWTVTTITEISREHFTRNAMSSSIEHSVEMASMIAIKAVDIALSLYLAVTVAVGLRINGHLLSKEGHRNARSTEIRYFVLVSVFTASTQIESVLAVIWCVSDFVGSDGVPFVLGDVVWPIVVPMECISKTVCLFFISGVDEGWHDTVCFVCHSLTAFCLSTVSRAEDERIDAPHSEYRDGGFAEGLQQRLLRDIPLHDLSINQIEEVFSADDLPFVD